MRLSDYHRQKIRNLGTAFINRLHHLNPPPEAFNSRAAQRYYECLPDDLCNVLTRLHELHDAAMKSDSASPILREERWVRSALYFTPEEKHLCGNPPVQYVAYLTHRLKLNGQDGYAFECAAPQPVSEHSRHYAALAAWASREFAVRNTITKAFRTFESINNACNTPGQWNRVLPQYTVLLDDELKRVIAGAQRRSPRPNGLVAVEKNIPALVNVFAQCAPLPPYDEFASPLTIETITRANR